MTQLFIKTKNNIRLMVDIRNQDRQKTVLFIHAGGEDSKVWDPIKPEIEALDWRTVAIDLRGHGQSDRAESYQIDDLIDDVVCVLERCCGHPVIIIGGSIGGILGTLVSGECHYQVDGLVLLDTPTRLPSIDGPKDEVRKIAAAKERGDRAAVAVDPKFLDGAFLEEIAREPHRLNLAAKQLVNPVLIICGEFSRYLTQDTIKEAHEDVPQVQIQLVPSGHLVAKDCPNEVTKMLANFLQNY